MRKLFVFLGFFLAVCSMSGGGLDSLTVEGRELHASLRTPPLDSFRNLPAGVVSPKNPQLSADEKFVQAIARASSMGKLDPDGIHSAFYARYAAGERQLIIYGLELATESDADQRENGLREIWAANGRLDRARVHREGLVLVVVWHSGVTSECWQAVNSRLVARLLKEKKGMQTEGGPTNRQSQRPQAAAAHLER